MISRTLIFGLFQAILVFLSGFKEITTAMEALTKVEYFQDSSNAVIYPLHSSLSNAEQKAIFDRPPKGKRKIVLSTNIAETSITVSLHFICFCIYFTTIVVLG